MKERFLQWSVDRDSGKVKALQNRTGKDTPEMFLRKQK